MYIDLRLFLINYKGKTLDRTRESTKSIRKSKVEKKQDVLQEYHRTDKSNKKPYGIAKTIRESLERRK